VIREKPIATSYYQKNCSVSDSAGGNNCTKEVNKIELCLYIYTVHELSEQYKQTGNIQRNTYTLHNIINSLPQDNSQSLYSHSKNM